MVSNYISDDIDITFQSENGFVRLGSEPPADEINKNITNAGSIPVTIKKGGAFFDSSMSFTIIRGGHVDTIILGALEVDEEGSLANWKIPGKMVPGMGGGAMDLVVGAKKGIVAMTHTQKGTHKILEKCTLPLTASKQVNLIITELAVIEVTDKGLLLKELGPNVKVDDVLNATSASLIIADDIKTFNI